MTPRKPRPPRPIETHVGRIFNIRITRLESSPKPLVAFSLAIHGGPTLECAGNGRPLAQAADATTPGSTVTVSGYRTRGGYWHPSNFMVTEFAGLSVAKPLLAVGRDRTV